MFDYDFGASSIAVYAAIVARAQPDFDSNSPVAVHPHNHRNRIPTVDVCVYHAIV